MDAGCPQCGRTVLGKDNPLLPLTELSLDDCKRIFPESFLQRLNRFELCGNFGDPIIARDTLEVCAWVRSVNPHLNLDLHSNGSARTTDWWAELGRVFAGGAHSVVFGIDGLADTNKLYRRHTDWDRIMRNAAAYIARGGGAQWQFILFRHNQHQVDAARRLADDMGFKGFEVLKTNRFRWGEDGPNGPRTPVHDRDGSVVFHIEPPDEDALVAAGRDPSAPKLTKRSTSATALDAADIRCQTAVRRSIFVSAEGLVFPCCWTAQRMYLYPQGSRSQIRALVDAAGGFDAINALKRPLEDIIDGPFISDMIPGSWSSPSLADGKLRVCAETCNLNDLWKQVDVLRGRRQIDRARQAT